jgi:hypothetical protein
LKPPEVIGTAMLDKMCVEYGRNILDELLLVLGRGLNGRSSLLLLATTASREIDATEEGAHDAHGELK